MKTVVVGTIRFVPALLLAVLASCSDGKTTPAAASTIVANSETTLSAVAGTTVSPVPSVIVRDQNDVPFAGATVTFNVVSGGGTITGESAVTDASGIATLGSWTLGKTAGANSLTATSGSLSVTFNATGTAGPTAQLTISAGDNQLGVAGAPVPVAPAVLVQDANGNGKPGVIVTFTVGDGGGSVTGATATSNASGVATAGSWTLGTVPAINTLIAATAGVPSVTFRAVASSAACLARTSHTLGSTTAGTLEGNDCRLADGSFIDFFSTVLPANAYLFRQSAGFDAYLDLELADGTVIAENDDATNTSTNPAIKALLPAGTYLLGASSFDPNVTGAYTVSSEIASPNNTGCEIVFVIRNVSTTQGIATNDCLWTQPPAAPVYADGFYILLRAGQSITVSMSSTAVDSYLEILRNNGTTVAQNDNRDATTKDARVTFTAAVTDYYAIVARTALASQTGAYSLTVQ